MQLPRERLKFRLASLNEAPGQFPHIRVRTLVRSAMREQDSTFANQRADNDLMHSTIRARTSDTGRGVRPHLSHPQPTFQASRFWTRNTSGSAQATQTGTTPPRTPRWTAFMP